MTPKERIDRLPALMDRLARDEFECGACLLPTERKAKRAAAKATRDRINEHLAELRKCF